MRGVGGPESSVQQRNLNATGPPTEISPKVDYLHLTISGSILGVRLLGDQVAVSEILGAGLSPCILWERGINSCPVVCQRKEGGKEPEGAVEPQKTIKLNSKKSRSSTKEVQKYYQKFKIQKSRKMFRNSSIFFEFNVEILLLMQKNTISLKKYYNTLC